MNNAAYAVHFEMARWEMAAANGLARHVINEKIAFIVASSAVRFRRELRPLQAFEVHTEVVAASDSDMHLLQIARSRGKVCAGSFVRAVLRRGRERLSPRELLGALNVGDVALPPTTWEGGDEINALALLEQAMQGEPPRAARRPSA